MRVAMIAPPWLPVPPRGYGGIELVVAELTEELVRRGHEVLLFAPGDSQTSARLVPTVPRHLGQNLPLAEARRLEAQVIGAAFARAAVEGVDLVHDHTLHHSEVALPTVRTLHGPATPETVRTCEMLSHNGQPNYFVAISRRQRDLFGPRVAFVGVVYNGLRLDLVPFADRREKEDFLLFVGRANWEKGVDVAVRVAVRARRRLVLAVKRTEDHERQYFAEHVAPWLDRGEITLLGEITPAEKFDLYRRAAVTLFTSQWEEPFGLVMVESMAAGTPVIAFPKGAAPEIIAHGQTGFLCPDEEAMVAAVEAACRLDPQTCRRHVLTHFSVARMADDYERVYRMVRTGAATSASAAPSG